MRRKSASPWLVALVVCGSTTPLDVARAESPGTPPVIVVEEPPSGSSAPPPADSSTYPPGTPYSGQPTYPPPSTYPPPTTYPPSQPYPSQPGYGAPPVYVQGPMQVVEPFSQRRIRGGFTVLAGPARPAGSGGAAGGFGAISARIGVQMNRTWGFYYQFQASLGALAYVDMGITATTFFGSVFNTVAASAAFSDRFEIAIGPSLDRVSSLSFKTDSSGSTVGLTAIEGTGFGLNGRISLTLGRVVPARMRRVGFTASLDLHGTFIDQRFVTLIGVGVGSEWF